MTETVFNPGDDRSMTRTQYQATRRANRQVQGILANLARGVFRKILQDVLRDAIGKLPVETREHLRTAFEATGPCPRCCRPVDIVAPAYVLMDEGHRGLIRLSCSCGCAWSRWVSREPIETREKA